MGCFFVHFFTMQRNQRTATHRAGLTEGRAFVLGWFCVAYLTLRSNIFHRSGSWDVTFKTTDKLRGKSGSLLSRLWKGQWALRLSSMGFAMGFATHAWLIKDQQTFTPSSPQDPQRHSTNMALSLLGPLERQMWGLGSRHSVGAVYLISLHHFR